MAQWVKGFYDLGGPRAVADPRVDEAATLGQLLMARQAQQQAVRRAEQQDAMAAAEAEARALYSGRALEAQQEDALFQRALAVDEADRKRFEVEGRVADQAARTRIDAAKFAAGREDALFARGVTEGREDRAERALAQKSAVDELDAMADLEALGLRREELEQRTQADASREALGVAGLEQRAREGRLDRRARARQSGLDREAQQRQLALRQIAELQQIQARAEEQRNTDRAQERAKLEAQATERRMQGLSFAVSNAAQKLQSAMQAGDPELVDAAIVAAFFPGTETMPDGKTPVWRPTSPEEVDALAEGLASVLPPPPAPGMLDAVAGFFRPASALPPRPASPGYSMLRKIQQQAKQAFAPR